MTPVSITLERLVHIIPIGHEINRVVSPFAEMKAHRVHLISMAETPDYDNPQDLALTSRQREYDRKKHDGYHHKDRPVCCRSKLNENLQFIHYNNGQHQVDLDNILLITPNERLTTQHLTELDLSSIPAGLFQTKTGSQQKEGEKILPSAVTGAYEITDIYEDITPLFTAPPQMGDERFPYRFTLKPLKIFSQPLEFKPLIPDLQFITNKVMWTGHLRTAMREIPEEDYLKIVKIGK